jgi:hypothetical protein
MTGTVQHADGLQPKARHSEAPVNRNTAANSSPHSANQKSQSSRRSVSDGFAPQSGPKGLWRVEIWDKKRLLSERSEFSRFPKFIPFRGEPA